MWEFKEIVGLKHKWRVPIIHNPWYLDYENLPDELKGVDQKEVDERRVTYTKALDALRKK